MPQKIKVASAQSRTLSTTAETLRALEATTKQAAQQGIDLILFPEAYLGGYPRTCAFGASVGARAPEGREQFLAYYHDAVDLGDTPQGAGEDWVNRTLPLPREKKYRGDGTREELERIARETGVFVVTGLVERSGGTLYCGAVYVCPRYGIIGKRRKVMPTGSERLVWGQGSASTLRAVTADIRGVRVTMAAAICWENYMPLLRQALYSQNVNLWLAPTADARDAWLSLMRTVGCEGRCFVISANQCVKKKHLPDWITGETATAETVQPAATSTGQTSSIRTRRRSTIIPTEDKHEICLPIAEENSKQNVRIPNGDHSVIDDGAQSPKSTSHALPKVSSAAGEEFVCRGGSSIISPLGDVLSGPLWEVDEGGLLVQEIDFEDCERGRLDMDVAGSYSRMDSFHLTVDGLDISPPP
ncbi:carbon-nitrogen hydrolase [Aaosphaeria arxii CBS 175.79]|uniref:Carbon-nitrogen hydrolase n=1 Tax=Aaosphaeria arxii CBS 175.79 TaxID=1450172 RepID=A0A6A5X7Z3_9PLEO|nr:carbon-nitrogen hydrolase [Aaosphaeria arxii CBS 175.79]KAF2009019.1 carbon-nitrogen hydrolase [Aaosphaeria arxii CBS 175.79]